MRIFGSSVTLQGVGKTTATIKVSSFIKKTVHEGKRFICATCDNEFTTPKALKIHEEKEHTDRELPYKCQEEGCSKGYWK